jgi:hypothetical protein
MTYRDNTQSFEDLDADLTNLQDFYRNIEDRGLLIDRLRAQYSRPFELSQTLRTMFPADPTLCKRCGLSKAEDIDHNPQDNPQPKGDAGMKAWQTYNMGQRKLYMAALEAFSNDRLVGVGIPNHRFFLNTLRDFVKKRLDDLTERHAAQLDQLRTTAPTRWDLINDDAE